MRVSAALALAWVMAGCASEPLELREQPHAALVVQHHVAEGNTGKPDAPAAATSAATSAAGAGSSESRGGDLPDPPALSERVQHEFTVHYLSGDIAVERIRRIELGQPRTTPRTMGRFAIELWIGKELLERVRFDFPLLGAEPPPQEDSKRPGFAAGADVTQTVLVPASERATRAHLVDRGTGEVIVLPWPPKPL